MIKNNKGFTLIEVMVALTVFALVATGVLWIYVNGYISYAKNNQKIEVQENLRIALNKMSRGIRQATVCIDVYDKVKDGKPATSGPMIKFGDLDGKIIQYSYDKTDREVEVKRGTEGSPEPIASCIENLEFQYDKIKKVVTIIIKGKPKNISPPVYIELKTEVQGRAL